MRKLLILLMLFSNRGLAYELVPPYKWQYGFEYQWNQYQNTKQKPPEVPYYLKPPSNWTAGDSGTVIANKYVMSQLDHIMQSVREDAVKMAKESNPGMAKSIQQVTNTNLSAETFHISHNFKYDVPSGVALYTAESSSVYFTARHESFASSDTMSLAYRLSKENSTGLRYTDTNNTLVIFVEGIW